MGRAGSTRGECPFLAGTTGQARAAACAFRVRPARRGSLSRIRGEETTVIREPTNYLGAFPSEVIDDTDLVAFWRKGDTTSALSPCARDLIYKSPLQRIGRGPSTAQKRSLIRTAGRRVVVAPLSFEGAERKLHGSRDVEFRAGGPGLVGLASEQVADGLRSLLQELPLHRLEFEAVRAAQRLSRSAK
jgi:hypothetical protein